MYEIDVEPPQSRDAVNQWEKVELVASNPHGVKMGRWRESGDQPEKRMTGNQ